MNAEPHGHGRLLYSEGYRAGRAAGDACEDRLRRALRAASAALGTAADLALHRGDDEQAGRLRLQADEAMLQARS